MNPYYIFIISSVLFGNLCLAQTRISGTVITSSGKKLSDVEISADGGLGFCTSDNDGKFIMNLSRTAPSSVIRLKAKKRFFQDWDKLITVGSLPLEISLLSAQISKTEGKPLGVFNCVTDALENQDFIFSNIPWPFKVNKDGEDIKSIYTPAQLVNQIHPLHPFTQSKSIPTIANKRLLVKLISTQNISDAIYIDKIYIQVLEKTKINEKTMFNNSWLPRISPNKYEIELNSSKTVFQIEMNDELVKILKEEPEFFNIKIKGDQSCDNFIFSFKILFQYVDSKGKKNIKESDRTYKIGFYKPDLNKNESIQENASNDNNSKTTSKIDTVVVPLSEEEKGPGETVLNTGVEKKCLEMIKNLNSKRSVENNIFDNFLQLGSILWKHVKDYQKNSIGINMQNVNSKNPNEVDEGRMIKKDEAQAFCANSYMKYLLSKMSKGKARPANNDERAFFYSHIGFEILGKPVTIVENNNLRLLIYLDDGKLSYLEVLYPSDVFDMNYFTFHSVYYLQSEDSTQLLNILNVNLNPKTNTDFNLKGQNDELPDTLFNVDILDMASNNTFIGLDRLIKDNPNSSRLFFSKVEEYNKLNHLESGSIIWELLCKIAINYRNFHSDDILINKLKKIDCYQMGGDYILNEFLFNHENKHGQQGKLNLNTLMITIGKTPFDKAYGEAIQVLSSLKYEKPEIILPKLKLIIPKILRRYNLTTSFADDYIHSPFISRNGTTFLNGGSLELILFTYALLLNGSNEIDRLNAKSVLAFCAGMELHYTDFVYYNLEVLKTSYDKVLPAITKINFEKDSLCFDDIVNNISGCSFGYINDMYSQYKSYWVKGDTVNAINIGDSILKRIDNCSLDLVTIKWLKKIILIYKTAYVSRKGDKQSAIRYFNEIPYFSSTKERELNYNYAVNDPNSVLGIQLFFLINDDLNKFYYGFKNGKLFE